MGSNARLRSLGPLLLLILSHDFPWINRLLCNGYLKQNNYVEF